MVGIALWLGSLAAAIATLIPLALLVARILVEERMLRARLDGYVAYAARVPWRIVPRVW
jgi:protein-S-isoprenylcysteine O-methyltransferase Ste14